MTHNPKERLCTFGLAVSIAILLFILAKNREERPTHVSPHTLIEQAFQFYAR